MTLVEIGSGTSEKTRLLLHALREAGTLRRFVAFDVDPAVLAEAGRAVAAEFRPIEVETIVGDFERHLALLPRHPHRLVAFLGSTIGNLEPVARVDFLRGVRATMGRGDAFLLGTDLVKPVPRLVSAYDDAAGITAAFNKNVLARHQPRTRRGFRSGPVRPCRDLGRDERVDRDAAAITGRADCAHSRA